jgi:hypothetical protein
MSMPASNNATTGKDSRYALDAAGSARYERGPLCGLRHPYLEIMPASTGAEGMGAIMKYMVGVQQGDQDIDVEQRAHP